MEIKCIKSADILLDIDCVNKGGLDLSKEVLWVFVGQREAVLQPVKVLDQKKDTNPYNISPIEMRSL